MYTCLGTSALSFCFGFLCFLACVSLLGTYLPTNIIVKPVFFFGYVHVVYVVDELESCFLVGDAYVYCVAQVGIEV